VVILSYQELFTLLQGQIEWIEVETSQFLHYVNVSSAAGHLYGVSVKQSGDEAAGPIHWASCLYDSSQRLYLNNVMRDFIGNHIVFICANLLHLLTIFLCAIQCFGVVYLVSGHPPCVTLSCSNYFENRSVALKSKTTILSVLLAFQ